VNGRGAAVAAGTGVLPACRAADGEEEPGAGDRGAGDRGAAEGAAAWEAGAPATASPGPPGTTASVIATPAAVSTPPAIAAPDRKLTSSIRA
jgi:hypothetical protein